jgi:hypothetical protein
MGATAPADAREALDMVRAGLGYLASADPGQLPTATQAECLRELERDAAVLTAARAWILASFTAGKGYADDADYSAVSWLIHRTRITHLEHIFGKLGISSRVQLATGLSPTVPSPERPPPPPGPPGP